MLSGGSEDLTILRGDASIARELRPWRLAAILLLVLGGLGLVAAATGIYGMMAYDVSQRRREWGIRLALGASSRAILREVAGSGIRVIALGLGIGAVAAVVAGRAIAVLLFQTAPSDPLILGVTAGVILAAALLASIIPAREACRVDPVRSLAD